MFLHILTLLVLASVVVLKYWTNSQTGQLKQKHIEMQNECHRGEHRHRMLCQEKAALQVAQDGLLVSRRETEDRLSVARDDLGEQQKKIQEMEARIDSMQ
jgi:hypothetical protein